MWGVLGLAVWGVSGDMATFSSSLGSPKSGKQTPPGEGADGAIGACGILGGGGGTWLT